MATEDYVSFETARLLKEKGFNEYCPTWYDLDKPLGGVRFYEKIGWYGHNSYSYVGYNIISAPTLQMAMKWLREVHHIFIRVIQSHIEYCTCEIYYNIVRHYEFRESFNSYEEACETAIKYCLENLI